MKTYTNKSNAKRALKTYSAKVSEYVEFQNVYCEDGAFGLAFVMAEDTPAEVLALISQFKVVVEQSQQAVEEPVPVVIAKRKGLKIQKNRHEKNGIKRPSAGGICARLWDIFEKHYSDTGMILTPKPAKEISAKEGLDPTTTTVQLYRWRDYMGF